MESMLSFNYDSKSSLTITFEDSDEVNLSFLEQALAFTLLGVGIPIVVSACIELVKMKADISSLVVPTDTSRKDPQDQKLSSI
jgi:hypothetical protein